MRYYIIAGEASGDLHSANLVKEIKKLDKKALLRGWGGDLMAGEGVLLVKHFRDLAFMGFVEVISNLRTILRNIELCKKDILDYGPDVLILVDYPGFNMRIAEFARKQNIKVVYYIAPQVWAWNRKRVFKLKKTVDRMLVILPFEKKFFEEYGMDVHFVGHPLLDAVADRATVSDPIASEKWKTENGLSSKPLVALLPGSRKQEIGVMLPLMLAVSQRFPDYQFAIAGAPSLPARFYEEYMSAHANVSVVSDKTYDLLQHAQAALVTSGTATLETALFNVPEVVCYKANRISYYIARSLIKVPYISLVNLVMEKEIVKELIQNQLTVDNMEHALSKLLNDEAHRLELMSSYTQLRHKLGDAGASERAATIIYSFATSVG